MNDIKIKICGMTRIEDIELVNRLHVDMAGFVLFFPKSKRNLGLDRAAVLAAKLDGVKSVAVTVSPTPEQAAAVERAGFDCIQIHGELSEETYNSTSLPVIRAFNDFDAAEIARCESLSRVEYCLFDAAEPGSGKKCDWNRLKELHTGSKSKKLILAGGLNPANVRAAIEAVSPYMVDVSSGVERPEGGKDAALAEAFVNAAREG